MSLLKIGWTDYKIKRIPDKWLLFMMGIILLVLMTGKEQPIGQHIWGALVVSIPMLVCAVCVRGSFGGGDIKLMSVGGLLLGWQNILLAFVIAVILAAGYLIAQMLRRKIGRKDSFAFGPALCAGIAISLLWGEKIICWYL